MGKEIFHSKTLLYLAKGVGKNSRELLNFDLDYIA